MPSRTALSACSHIRTTALFKPAATTLGAVTINCGYVTCSAYLSRSATLDAYQNEGEAAAADELCDAFAELPPLAVACEGIVLSQEALIDKELDDAATQHGANGACLKVTFTKIIGDIPPAITWWSTNNGQYCKN